MYVLFSHIEHRDKEYIQKERTAIVKVVNDISEFLRLLTGLRNIEMTYDLLGLINFDPKKRLKLYCEV